MSSTSDVIVIGGGAIGAACARELALAGRRVLVIEPADERGEAWRAAAGMLAPQIEAAPDDPVFELALAGREEYFRLVPILLDATGIDVALWRGGIVSLARTHALAAELRERAEWQRQAGLAAEWLEADEVRYRWPWLAPVMGALWAEHEGALDPMRLVAALLADARRAGARVVQDEAVEIQHSRNQVTAVVTRNGRYAADGVVVTAGAWSGGLAGIPRRMPVVPVRGQMAALAWPDGVERAIVYHGSGYVMARGSEAVAGSTMERVGFDNAVTAEGIARVVDGARSLSPRFASAPVLRTWSGLRPVAVDGIPIIGAEPLMHGLWYATGHGRNGILLAAVTGRIVGQLLAGFGLDAAPLPLERFSVERFAGQHVND